MRETDHKRCAAKYASKAPLRVAIRDMKENVRLVSNPMSWEEAVSWLKGQPDQQDLVRACFYDDPLVESAERFSNSAEWMATRQLFSTAKGRSLDIGAGRGIASYALAKDGWRVTAIEPDNSDLVGAGAIRALARAARVPIEVVEQWGETLPFDDESFDLVLCRQVLHHARDLSTFCNEVGRVLRPKGIMVATREHVLSAPTDLPVFLAKHPLHHLYGGENAFLLADYLGAIKSAGLSVTKIFNPLQSDINTFPLTIEDHRALLARRWGIPKLIVPKMVMGWLGSRMTMPGRLYSFVAAKPS
jgi:2-polyprenyl-3-methyl-5-hydroxy-6-metoxy-1,4-benzoquinol methylase